MKQQCNKTCKLFVSYGKKLDKIIGKDVPVCKNKKERQCAQRVIDNVETTITSEPCTKLQYQVDASSTKSSGNQGPMRANQVIFAMSFANPPRVMVKEEYIIYDTVAMIRSGH